MYNNNYNSLSWIRGNEKGNVNIGEKVWIGPFCVIDGEYDKVSIGDGVNISSGTQILTHDTVKRCVTGGRYNQIEHAPTKIGNYVYIGTNAVILKGSIIGDYCIIAAGSVVKEFSNFPPFSLIAGVPAIAKRSIEEEYQNWIRDEHTF